MKFELFMPLESKEVFLSLASFFSLIRDIEMHFVSCFLREKKDVASFFLNRDIGLWKTGKKRLVLFNIDKEGRLQHHRQCSKGNFEEDQTTTTTKH